MIMRQWIDRKIAACGKFARPILVPATLMIVAIMSPYLHAQTTSTFAIAVTPNPIAFSGPVGPGPLTLPVTFTNTGTSTVSFTWTDSISWIRAGYPSGTLAPGASKTFTMTATISGMTAGTYSGTGTVSAGGVSKSVPITLTLAGSTTAPAVGLSPTSLAFSGTAGGTNPAAKTFSVSNTGGGTLSWTASDNVAWLSLSPAAGTNSGTVTASVNVAGLAAGTYNGVITVTATGASNSPRTIPVTLTLSTAGTGTGTSSGSGSATLTWNANSDTDLAGYKVYRATASGAYGAPVATVAKTATSYVASGLTTGTTYFFVVTAYDTAGNESPFSNEVSKSIF
jgi:hypothetical protein